MKSNQEPIFIISGGAGASGEQVVQTILAQFEGYSPAVNLVTNVRDMDEIDETLQAALAQRGTVVHTLVDPSLRNGLLEKAKSLNVPAFDLMGPLIDHFSKLTDIQAKGHPGLYRSLNMAYFERMAAIEYTMAHDDGKNPSGWDQADALILGVSRTGKTPLSLYLSVLGWQIANFPLVPEITPPSELIKIDPKRVVGLDIEIWQLLQHRKRRQEKLGAPGYSKYTDPEAIQNELDEARKLYRRHGFKVINVTDKPVESSADDVIRLVRRKKRPLRAD